MSTVKSYEPRDRFKQCPGCGEFCGCKIEPAEQCEACGGTLFETEFTPTKPAKRSCSACGAKAPWPKP